MKITFLAFFIFFGTLLLGQNMNTINFDIIDPSTNPADDFYRFCSGKWLDDTTLPSDRERFGFFDTVNKKTEMELLLLMKSFDEDDINQQKLSRFYESGMKVRNQNQIVFSDITEQIEQIDSITNKEDLWRVIANFQLIGVNPLFEISFPKYWFFRGAHYLYLNQTNLSFENLTYYSEEKHQTKRDSFKNEITNTLILLDYSNKNASDFADKLLYIEKQLALKSQLEPKLSKNYLNYNLYKAKKLKKKFPNIFWSTYFDELKLSEKKTIIGQPQYFEEINKLIGELSIDDWKAYFKWKLCKESEKYIHYKATDSEQSLFVAKTISKYLPIIVGNQYVKYYFTQEDEQNVLEIISNLKSAFIDRIQSKNWLSEKTKKEAVDKITTLDFKVGGPKLPVFDNSLLKIDSENFVQNVFNSRKFEALLKLQKAGQEIKDSEWFVDSHSTNAWYSVNRNAITLPAGNINQIFNSDYEKAYNYGVFAPTIAHEMTHSLDNTGRLYTSKGKYKNWWKKDEIVQFNSLSDKLIS